MGVNSLWDIVGPAARPVKLEALSRKKLAVDASIWIYQFLKAVRDKEGNSLKQSHIVGFFRRICKLLYYGILPLFVFDGGAPALKRKVIQHRKERRMESQQDATMTAQKLLAMQLQNRGTSQKQTTGRAKAGKARADGDTVYLEDMPILHSEHGSNSAGGPQLISSNESSPKKRFIKKDEYHLPELRQFTIAKDDNRILPASEFQEYAENANIDTVDGIDIDSVDPASKEFSELPLATQYMMLSHLRLRSRLRLGYTKDQLEGLFPDSRDFSRFQIEQVKKRNFYTQRLMNVSGMAEDSGNITRRIAGDKDRHYALVKNDDGWTLSLGTDEGDVVEYNEDGEVVKSLLSSLGDEPKNSGREKVAKKVTTIGSSSSSDDEFEDVAIGEAEEDSDYNKAIIESIYELHKHDYEDASTKVSSGSEGLREAVERSKSLYFESEKKERQLEKRLHDLTNESGSPDFQFSGSILFGSGTASDGAATSKVIEEVPTSPSSDGQPEETPSTKYTQTMPSWFDQNISHIDKPHSGDVFLQERPEAPKENEDEKAGLISWSEARELFERREPNQPTSPPDSEIESVEEVVDRGLPKFENSEDDVVEVIPQVDEENAEDSIVEIKDIEENGPDSKEIEKAIEVREFTGTDNTKDTEKATETEKGTEPDVTPEHIPETESLLSDREAPLEVNSEKNADVKSEEPVFDYEIEEEDEKTLMKQLEEEEDQHSEFTKEIKSKHQIPITASSRITDEQLYQERIQKAKRDADEVSQSMIHDVQELLRRFGIPFITAPMEAEAQCAELFRLKMVDGIITDDSDCFLFGGSRIYRNMFNQKQYVECYFNEEVEHKIGLDREKLIELAILLGSDYTEGVKGIGPVLAMEILAEFGNLKLFKKWFDENARNFSSSEEPETPLKKNLKSRIKSGKLFLPDNFPDQVVFHAYTHPEVDRDESEFKWGVPNLDQIRSFLMYNVGWTQARVDEVMLPLIRDMNRKRAEGTQSTIGEFFSQEYISYKKNAVSGKRMKLATERLHQNKKRSSQPAPNV